MSTSPSDPDFYEAAEVGKRIKRTPTRVRQLVAAGEIPGVRVGNRIRIPARAFEAWLDAKNQEALRGAGINPRRALTELPLGVPEKRQR